MPLPTFLTAAELLVLNERIIKARAELNEIVFILTTAGELNLRPQVANASGLLYKASNKIAAVVQKRIAGHAAYVAENVREGAYFPGTTGGK